MLASERREEALRIMEERRLNVSKFISSVGFVGKSNFSKLCKSNRRRGKENLPNSF